MNSSNLRAEGAPPLGSLVLDVDIERVLRRAPRAVVRVAPLAVRRRDEVVELPQRQARRATNLAPPRRVEEPAVGVAVVQLHLLEHPDLPHGIPGQCLHHISVFGEPAFAPAEADLVASVFEEQDLLRVRQVRVRKTKGEPKSIMYALPSW